MAYVFYIIGWIVFIVGAVTAGIAISQMGDISQIVSQLTNLNVAAVTPLIAAVTAGAGVMFTGLLILAVGGVLGRLDRIVRNTRP